MINFNFSSRGGKTPETKFWQWFEKNQDALFNFEGDQGRLFDKLSKVMAEIHPDLTFEFGPNESGKREFVLSAGGIRAAFPAVDSLFAAAPELPNWKFIKFRPRRSAMDISFAGVEVCTQDALVGLESDGNKAGLTVFIKDYAKTDNSVFEQAAYLMLDQAIGEYDMETKVGFIKFRSMIECPQSQTHSLEKLPAVFDSFMREDG